MKFAKLTVSLLCLVSMIACGNSKALSDAALKTATDAYAAVSADAQKYVPDQAKTVQDAIAGAQAASAKGDYAAALDQAKGIPAKVTDLSAAIAAKKSELTKSWTDMSTACQSGQCPEEPGGDSLEEQGRTSRSHEGHRRSGKDRFRGGQPGMVRRDGRRPVG